MRGNNMIDNGLSSPKNNINTGSLSPASGQGINYSAMIPIIRK